MFLYCTNKLNDACVCCPLSNHLGHLGVHSHYYAIQATIELVAASSQKIHS
jgi:hypothetical protein